MKNFFHFPKPSERKHPQEKQRGQVAIFIALIFQVLFVFFAMLVNVGLLVHHKINLQNSVDLAAYYGAAKQAEIMNVIAHANYQIRQSWKLFVFRYRQVGSFGDEKYPGRSGGSITTQSDTASNINPAFCLAYNKFNFMQADEDYCKTSGQGTPMTLPKPPVPSFVAAGLGAILGLQVFAQANIAATQQMNAVFTAACKEKSALSYFELMNFLYAWKRDISNRKMLIYGLANQLSSLTSDFPDLDGRSTRTGVVKTFTKNLTYQNLQSINNQTGNITFFNSLGGTAGASDTPPAWMADIRIFPVVWAYISQNCSDTNNVVFQPFAMNIGQAIPTDIANDASVGAAITQIEPYIEEPPVGASAAALLKAASLGVEKNPWYVPYVGVHATAAPQIPFSPFGTVTLQATAYAKIFGGTVGPWYGTSWPAGAPESQGAAVDSGGVMPQRFTGSPPTSAQAVSTQYNPDHTRYVGDRLGSSSAMNLYNAAQVFNQFPVQSMSLQFWSHLVDPNDNLEQIGANGDMLAWSNPGANAGQALLMRQLETAAIAPDQWDTSYYSVEPDYYNNYIKRIGPRQGTDLPFPIRGDLGQRAQSTDPALVKFSIKDQITRALELTGYNVTSSMTFHVNSPAELLTSWKGMAPDNPVMDIANNFGKCSAVAPDGSPTSGNCVAGGRVGYSVKFVDPDFFNNPSSIGGQGTSGVPANPPPAGWY